MNDEKNMARSPLSPEHYHQLTEEEKDLELQKSINRVHRLVNEVLHPGKNAEPDVLEEDK